MYGLQVKCRGRDLQEKFSKHDFEKYKLPNYPRSLHQWYKWGQSLFKVEFEFFPRLWFCEMYYFRI